MRGIDGTAVYGLPRRVRHGPGPTHPTIPFPYDILPAVAARAEGSAVCRSACAIDKLLPDITPCDAACTNVQRDLSVERDESGGKNSLTVFTYDVYIRLLSTAMRHKRVQPDTPRALQLHHHVDRSLERRDDSNCPAQRTLTDRGHESRPTLAGKRSGRSYGATASRPCETCWDTPNAQAIRRELTAPLPHCSACSAAASG